MHEIFLSYRITGDKLFDGFRHTPDSNVNYFKLAWSIKRKVIAKLANRQNSKCAMRWTTEKNVSVCVCVWCFVNIGIWSLYVQTVVAMAGGHSFEIGTQKSAAHTINAFQTSTKKIKNTLYSSIIMKFCVLLSLARALYLPLCPVVLAYVLCFLP